MKSEIERIKDAFTILRNEGYFAEGNYMCCSSCARASLVDKDKYVFWNEQSHSNSFGDKLTLKNELWLKWRGDANRIVQVLQENGINASWNGDEEMGICITPNLETLSYNDDTKKYTFTQKKNLYKSFVNNKGRRFIDITNKFVNSNPFFINNATVMASLLFLYNDQTGKEINNITSIHEFHKLLTECKSIIGAQECYSIYIDSVYYAKYQDYLSRSKGMSDEKGQEENGWLLNGDSATLSEIQARFKKFDIKLLYEVLEIDKQIDEYFKKFNGSRFNDFTNEELINIEFLIDNYLSSEYCDKEKVQGLMLFKDQIQSVKRRRLENEKNERNSLPNKIKNIFTKSNK